MTLDELREYDLKIAQPRHGYRFSVDPLLLCRFAGAVPGSILDLGSGSGVMALIMARLSESCRVVGVEVDEETSELARRNVALNGLDDRVEIITDDILNLKKRFPVSTFELVLANPPFRRRGTGKISPRAGRDTARHESTAGLGDFLTIAKYLVKPTGRISVVYHVSRLTELSVEADRLKLAILRLQMVHWDEGSEARLFLVELAKGRTGELRILPPRFLRSDRDVTSCNEEAIKR